MSEENVRKGVYNKMKKLVMMALICAVVCTGCGSATAQNAQETVAQTAETGTEEAETEEVGTENAEKQETTETGDKEEENKKLENKETESKATEEKNAKEAENKTIEDAETEKDDKSVSDNKVTETEDKDTNAEAAKAEVSKIEDAEAAESPALPEYTVTPFESPKVMFASNPVNVRKGPTTDFERVGTLNRGQEVTVTGQADTDWYEILYGEEKVFVSDHYLQNEKPAEPAPQSTPADAGTQPTQAVTEVKNVAGVILVGDSRFVQMQENVGANSCTWIAENGKGYKWLNETAMARIDGCVGKGSKILINLGVNDPENARNYLELINAKSAEWVNKGAKVYYASVNPVWDNPYTTKEEVEAFNSQVQSGLSGNVHWIDSYSYLHSIGFKLVDGLHFNAETYQNIYAYYMSCL